MNIHSINSVSQTILIGGLNNTKYMIEKVKEKYLKKVILMSNVLTVDVGLQ